MANTKPLVTVACFCETLLEDKDGVLSAIRIVDIYFVEPPAEPPPGVPSDAVPAIEVTGLVSLKSGDLVGPFNIGLVVRRPNQEPKELSPKGGWPVVFSGGEHGVNLKLKFPMAVNEFGLCWFDVMFGKDVLTSIPLKLVKGQKPAQDATLNSQSRPQR